eukprot:1161247-Pelagomonas_calceolata.AAC.5
MGNLPAPSLLSPSLLTLACSGMASNKFLGRVATPHAYAGEAQASPPNDAALPNPSAALFPSGALHFSRGLVC